MNKYISQFQKECFANYIDDIRKAVPEIPKPYVYPDGNPIRTVIPVRTIQNSIMLIGAFPSARFERRNKLLIPIGDNLWITDIVKIYLFPEKHIKNCEVIAPNIKFVNTHKLFSKIAKASMEWMKKEITICDPKLIITLGEVPTRVISGNKKTSNAMLLNGQVRDLILDKKHKVAHLGHPEIRRINKHWDIFTEEAIKTLAKEIERL